MQKALLIVLALILLLPDLIDKDVNPVLAYNKTEQFDARLSYINSIDKLELYIDSIAAAKNIQQGSYEYAALLGSTVEQRFYHGFSHYTLSENWIAALAGKFLKEDYACIVQPDQIMQHPNAACSQQAIVMMAVLRVKKISYRSLGFPHHYTMEVLAGNEWYFFDANLEPVITKEQRMLSTWKHHSDHLKKYYDSNRFPHLDYMFGNGLVAPTGVIDEVPAKNARLFHTVTGFLSKIFWCFPLLFIFYRPRFSAKLPFVLVGLQKRKPFLSLSV